MYKLFSCQGLREISLFVVLDVLHYLCWKGQIYFYTSGPIDSQGLMVYVCIYALYVLISFSLLAYVIYIRYFFKNIFNSLLASVLNTHVFVIAVVYVRDTIIYRLLN